MTRPTGRPRGRPPGAPYGLLTVRVPQDLIDQVKTYAGRHQQSVSELIRDGLQWRLDEGDPHAYLTELLAAPLHPGLTLVLHNDDTSVIHNISDVIHEIEQPNVADELCNTENSIDVIQHEETATPVEQDISVLHENNTVLQEVPDFDTARYRLGEKPCPSGHTWPGTGVALLDSKKRWCVECQRASQKKTKHAWRARRTVARTV